MYISRGEKRNYKEQYDNFKKFYREFKRQIKLNEFYLENGKIKFKNTGFSCSGDFVKYFFRSNFFFDSLEEFIVSLKYPSCFHYFYD